jgi:hypothetical protein
MGELLYSLATMRAELSRQSGLLSPLTSRKNIQFHKVFYEQKFMLCSTALSPRGKQAQTRGVVTATNPHGSILYNP